MPKHLPMKERFWAKVDKNGPLPTGHPAYTGLGRCWIFSGGQGSIANDFAHLLAAEGEQVRVYAHRYSYELHIGPIPDGAVVRHKCDNGHLHCVNPKHLEAGTQADNIKDWYRRRPRKDIPLTPGQVDALRTARDAHGVPLALLAACAGVVEGTLKSAIYSSREGTTAPTVKQRRAPNVTPEEVAEVRGAIEAGATLRAALLPTGRDQKTMVMALAKAGFDYPAFDATRKLVRNARAVELYRGGMSALAAGKVVGLTGPALKRVLVEAGVYHGWSTRQPAPA